MKNKILFLLALMSIAFNVYALDVEPPYISEGLTGYTASIKDNKWEFSIDIKDIDKDEYYISLFDGEFEVDEYLTTNKNGCVIKEDESINLPNTSLLGGDILVRDGIYRIVGKLKKNSVSIISNEYDGLVARGANVNVLNMMRGLNKYVIVKRIKADKQYYCTYTNVQDLAKATIPNYQKKYQISHTKSYGVESFQLNPQFKYGTSDSFYVKIGEVEDEKTLKIFANKLKGFENYLINKAVKDDKGIEYEVGWEIPATIQVYPTPEVSPVPNSLFAPDKNEFKENNYYYVYVTYGKEANVYRDFLDVYITQYKDDVLTTNIDVSKYVDKRFTTNKSEYIEPTTLTSEEIKEKRKEKKQIDDSINMIVLITAISIVLVVMFITVTIIKYKSKKKIENN